MERELLKLVESELGSAMLRRACPGFKGILDRITRVEEGRQRLEERTLEVEEAISGPQKTLVTVAHRLGVRASRPLGRQLRA